MTPPFWFRWTLTALKWRLHDYLNEIGHPKYDCQNCLGMPEYGCYCSIQGASAPGVGPTWKQLLAKKAQKWLLKI